MYIGAGSRRRLARQTIDPIEITRETEQRRFTLMDVECRGMLDENGHYAYSIAPSLRESS
jgi:hypothetical protein